MVAGKEKPRLAALLKHIEGFEGLGRNPTRIVIFRRIGETPHASTPRTFFDPIARVLAVLPRHIGVVASFRCRTLGAKRTKIVKAE